MSKEKIELFRPSNGTHGESFMSDFCYQCKHESEENPCEIIFLTMAYDIDDPEYPNQWQYNSIGEPYCTEFCRLPI